MTRVNNRIKRPSQVEPISALPFSKKSSKIWTFLRIIPFFLLSLILSRIYLNLSQGTVAFRNLSWEDSSNIILLPALDENHIHYSGRILRSSNTQSVKYDWPCVSFSFALLNVQRALVRMNGANNRFLVEISAQNMPTIREEFETNDQLQPYSLASELKPGIQYTFKITKLNEASSISSKLVFLKSPGIVDVKTLVFEGYENFRIIPLQEWFSLKSKKIEFFGNSDTNAFGVLGSINSSLVSCVYHAIENQNCALGFPTILSHDLDADFHIEAWSGKGVYKNADSLSSSLDEPMPTYWDRTLANWAQSSENLWPLQTWIPDLVVIMLGSNDYQFNPPSDHVFISAYQNLLSTIRHDYGNSTPILNLCGGHHVNPAPFCDNIETAVHQFNLEAPTKNTFYLRIPDTLIDATDFGCISHWNGIANQKVASFLKPFVSELLRL